MFTRCDSKEIIYPDESNRVKTRRSSCGAIVILLVLVLLSCFSTDVESKTIEVTAEYKPTSYEVSGGSFISTTPCQRTDADMSIPLCRGGIASLDSLLFSIDQLVLRDVKEKIGNPKDAFVFIASSGQKNMVVTSDKGKQFTVSFIPDKLGVHMDAKVSMNIARQIFSDAFTNPQGGCRYVNRAAAGYYTMEKWMVLWEGIAGKSCYTPLSVDVSAKVKAMFFGFKIRPPSPLDMPNGTYRGSMVLSVGQSGDISLGNGSYSDNQLIINLTLVVRHQLKVIFPMSNKQMELLPPGGWLGWIHNSGKRSPESLTAVLPAYFWASAAYNLRLKCQMLNSAKNRCLIKNAKNNHSVEVNVYATGMRKKEYLIYPDRDENYYGHSVLSGDERPFRFEITGEQVGEMMKRPGGIYKGDITIVIDAAI